MPSFPKLLTSIVLLLIFSAGQVSAEEENPAMELCHACMTSCYVTLLGNQDSRQYNTCIMECFLQFDYHVCMPCAFAPDTPAKSEDVLEIHPRPESNLGLLLCSTDCYEDFLHDCKVMDFDLCSYECYIDNIPVSTQSHHHDTVRENYFSESVTLGILTIVALAVVAVAHLGSRRRRCEYNYEQMI